MGCAAGTLGSAPTAAVEGLAVTKPAAAGMAVVGSATVGSTARKSVVAGEGPATVGMGP